MDARLLIFPRTIRKNKPDPAPRAQGIRAGFLEEESAPPISFLMPFIPAASRGEFGRVLVNMRFKHFKPEYNFLGVKSVPLAKADVIILPIPYDATTSYQTGTRFGPHAAITASRQVELYDSELKRDVSAKVKIVTLPEVEPDLSGPEANTRRLTDVARELIQLKKFVVSIGGEHSVTPGLVAAYKEKYRDLTVLQIDAHTDMRETYEGTKWNHACAMKRCHDLGVHVVHVGIRNSAEEEQQYIDPKNVFYAPAVPLEKILSRIQTKDVYLTVDVDGFDPSIMPSTGTPEPGGLGWYQVLELIRALMRERRVVGADVVELAPIPGMIAPDFLAAKLMYKIIGYKFFNYAR